MEDGSEGKPAVQARSAGGGGRRRAGGGAEARRQKRLGGATQQYKFITRRLAPFEVLSEEGLSLIEENAETILQEVGVNIVEDEETLALFKEAGADVSGERVRFPRGLLRSLVATAPSEFVQHARNPERSVTIGGPNLVFAPVYGPPFFRSLDEGRRYATNDDFRTLVKLTYLCPELHHSGGTVCEPVDLPVNKRHLDMLFNHIKYSDKPFMGSVTQPERAADTVEMAKILFGADFVDQNCVLINVNSPLTYDSTMLGALKAYARAGQACIVAPFILAGAMAPVTPAGVLAQTLAEGLVGMALTQILRPGAPVVFGSFASSMSMQSGAPTFGTPEPALVLYGFTQLARRLGVPCRSGGSLCAAKVPDAQAAAESAQTLLPSLLGGVNFVLHSAGWLEGGLVSSPEKLIIDADQLGMMHTMSQGIDLSENGQAMGAIREVGPGSHFLGCQHTQANFESAFYRSKMADNNSFEQWEAEGSKDTFQRANERYKKLMAEYQAPPLDPALEEGLTDYISKKKQAMPDAFT